MILQEGKQKRPRRVLLYGPHGTGKSTWAACAPNHVFLSFEGGLNDIDCRSTDRIKSFSELLTILMELSKEPKELDWIVFDTLDWLESLVHRIVTASTAMDLLCIRLPACSGRNGSMNAFT